MKILIFFAEKNMEGERPALWIGICARGTTDLIDDMWYGADPDRSQGFTWKARYIPEPGTYTAIMVPNGSAAPWAPLATLELTVVQRGGEGQVLDGNTFDFAFGQAATLDAGVDNTVAFRLPILRPTYQPAAAEGYPEETDRNSLIVDCNKRLGKSVASLQARTTDELRGLFDSTLRDRVVAIDEAMRHLEDFQDEPDRFRAFVEGDAERRSLLVGWVPAQEFLDFWTLRSPETETLRTHANHLRGVVQRILELGGIHQAAQECPWLEQCLAFYDDDGRSRFDFKRLSRNLPFVRLCDGIMHIEEGQHRAIVAALMIEAGQGPEHVWFLRGCNRDGHDYGDNFWSCQRRYQ